MPQKALSTSVAAKGLTGSEEKAEPEWEKPLGEHVFPAF